MKDKDKVQDITGQEIADTQDDKINVTKSVFQVNREMHEQKLAELEEKQRELERQAQERKKKKRDEYERRILEEKKELMRLKQGIIEESETIHEEHEEQKKLTPWQAVKNFFYHNKWWLGLGIFFAAVGVFLIVNLLSKPRPDMVVLVIGEYDSVGYSEGLENYVASFADDFNGNGKTEVSIYYIPYSEDSYKNYANGVDTKLTTQLQMADSVIVIGGDSIGNILTPESVFADLEGLYPENPHVEDYYFYLKDTPFAKRIGADTSDLDDSLFLAIRTPQKLMYSDEEDMQETYDRDFPVFDAMIKDLSE